MISATAADLPRCSWAAEDDPAMARYHDEEWGVETRDAGELFERLVLECFQAGLSWSTILRKRDPFRRAFDGFDPAIVAGYGADDVARLMADAGIVRNRAKIEATIGNAGAFLALDATTVGGFAGYLDRFLPPPPARRPADATMTDLPGSTPTAKALSDDLRARGFRFVGPTIVYAFLQSVGRVDDHLPGCFRYRGP
jgi:DNA-3-methyladenine glycosylase I